MLAGSGTLALCAVSVTFNWIPVLSKCYRQQNGSIAEHSGHFNATAAGELHYPNDMDTGGVPSRRLLKNQVVGNSRGISPVALSSLQTVAGT